MRGIGHILALFIVASCALAPGITVTGQWRKLRVPIPGHVNAPLNGQQRA